MKQIIKIGTHVIICGACMLVVAQAFDNVWELIAYCLASMILGATCCVIRQKELPFWAFIGSHLLLMLGGVSAISVPEFRDWYAVIWVVLILYSALHGFGWYAGRYFVFAALLGMRCDLHGV